MVARETQIVNFFQTTLTQQMNPTDLVANVVTIGDITGDVLLVIEPDNPSQREVILFDGTHGSTNFSSTTIANRYLAGSAASSGLTHPVNSDVVLAVVKQHIDDVHDRVDVNEADIATNVADISANTAAIASNDVELAAHRGSDDVVEHPLATNATDGFLSSVIVTRYEAALETDALMLDAIKNVDGPGSGLDADTLDGQEASEFFNVVSHTKAAHDALLLDAATLDGVDSTSFARTDLSSETFDGDVVIDGGDVAGSSIAQVLNLRGIEGGNTYLQVDHANTLFEFVLNGTERMQLAPDLLTLVGVNVNVGGGNLWGNGSVLNLRASNGGTDYFQVDEPNSFLQGFINNTERLRISSGGAAVTGNLSATGDITASGADFIGSGTGGIARIRASSSVDTFFEASDAANELRFWVQGDEPLTVKNNRVDLLADSLYFLSASFPYDNLMSTLRWGGPSDAGGRIHQSYSASSRSIKKAIRDYDLRKARFGKLTPKTWFYRKNAPGIERYKQADLRHFGLIAEDTQEVAPDLVNEDGGIAYDSMRFLQEFVADYLAFRSMVMEQMS